jgi:formiminotetrahydrofolate cyclodeaminase
MSSLHIRSLGNSPTSIWTMDVAGVRDLTASLSPTPGGGSISVLTATLGLALVHKGASISLKRAGEDAVRRETLSGLSENIQSALASMSNLVDDDSQAFQDYLAARSLPQVTENEKAARHAAMQDAILEATRVPLRSAGQICAGLEYAARAVALSDFHLLTDVVGGAFILQAAAKAVLLSVVANVSLLSDGAVRAALEKERDELERCSLERGEAIAEAYRTRNSTFSEP